jgi:hypothetical protein
MDYSVAELFVILALNPEKGRISLDSIHFSHSLTGALLMDYHERGDFTTENKRIIPSFKKNGEILHDLIADQIMKSGKNRRISFWIGRLANKSRLYFRAIVSSLEKRGILRIEQKKFLNIFPYKRYWFTDNSVRNNTIETLRGSILYGKKADKKEIMLLGLVEASRAYKVLSREKGEAKLLRRKNTEFLKGDVISSEISQSIREVQAAVVASISAAAAASHAVS